MEYTLRVSEIWEHEYYIEADSPEQAWKDYLFFAFGPGVSPTFDTPNVRTGDTIYIADMDPDNHVMLDEQDNHVEFLDFIDRDGTVEPV
jgi:hypothetical protein